MPNNSQNNRRAELAANASIDLSFNNIEDALSSKYDLVQIFKPHEQDTSLSSKVKDMLTGDGILSVKSQLNNSYTISLTGKHDVYKTRLYSKGGGNFQVSLTGEIYKHEEDVGIGSIPTEVQTVTKKRQYLFFKNNKYDLISTKLNELSNSAQIYYLKKAILNEKRQVSQGTFSLYFLTTLLTYLAAIVFGVLTIYAIVKSFLNINLTIFEASLFGVKSLWLSVAATSLLWVLGALLSARVGTYRITGEGSKKISFSSHCFVIIIIQLLTMLFALVNGFENIFGYILGWVIYPLSLANVLYPVIMIFLLFASYDEFNVEAIYSKAKKMSEPEYLKLEKYERDIIDAAVQPEKQELIDISVMNIYDPDIEVSLYK